MNDIYLCHSSTTHIICSGSVQ